MEWNRKYSIGAAALIALLVVLVIAIVAAVVFGVMWGQQKAALDAVCTDLVGAEAKHVSELLDAVNKLRVQTSKTPGEIVPVLAKFLRESYGVNAMYQNVAAYCPDIAGQVQARMAGHTAAIQQAMAAARSDPDAALAALQSHLKAHAASLRAYLAGVGTALSAAWAAKTA